MQVYTYSQARQQLAAVLKEAEDSGQILIQKKDGQTFSLKPVKAKSSPLDIPSIKANISTQEMVRIIRQGRER